MNSFNWHGKELKTQKDFVEAVKKVGTPEEAQEFMSAYRSVNVNADDNVGWLIGEVNRDVGTRIIEWFGCSHPVFGTKFPSAEEAFR